MAEWVTNFAGPIAGKVVLNFALPGLGSIVDFAQAGYCLYNGDILGCAINTVSGAADVFTLGMASSAKEIMKESAKGAVAQTAKETAKSASKQATKKVGQDLGKQLAKGLITGGKDAAIQTAKETAKTASKEATKQVGQQVAKEIARGVVTESVEEALREATKLTLSQMGYTALLGAVSSGGKQVGEVALKDFLAEVLKSAMENYLSETMKQGSKKVMFELTKDAAKAAALAAAKKELMKNSSKLFVKDVFIARLKAARNGLEISQAEISCMMTCFNEIVKSV